MYPYFCTLFLFSLLLMSTKMEASAPKRAKMQKTLTSFYPKAVGRRLVSKGNLHQADIITGGNQCVCAAVCFLCKDNIPKRSSDVDELLYAGTALYNLIGSENMGMTIDELPPSVHIFNQTYRLSFYGPKCGLVSQRSNDSETLTFSVDSALQSCLEEATTCIFTLGNSPGTSIAIRKENNSYFGFDSHSRDENGMVSPSGKAVVLQISSLHELSKYVADLAYSIAPGSNIPFEATSVSITESSLSDERPIDVGLSDDTQQQHSPTDVPSRPKTQQQPSDTPAETHAQRQPSDAPTQSQTQRQPRDAPTQSQTQRQPSNAPTQSQTQRLPSDAPTRTQRLPSDASAHSAETLTATGTITDNENSQILDIKHYNSDTFTDSMKFALITQSEPDQSYTFPPRVYKDKRNKSGYMNRYCQRDWFKTYDFISYSKEADALYCLACVMFPDTSHRRAKKLITEPYSNWKDATADIGVHSTHQYHLNSMEKFENFKKTHKDASRRIDVSMTTGSTQAVARNRKILESIMKTVVFCGRQGIVLRSHRDDDTSSSSNMGNFKELLKFRVDAGDEILQDHLSKCSKTATYTSKTTQNDLLCCLKMFMQNKIVDEVRSQVIGPYFGLQCDEVTDSSNWEQLGIVLRYTSPDSRPIERLLGFVPCEEITGAAIAEKILQSLSEAGLDPSFCRSQTMDGAGNMAGRVNGCAALIRQQYPKAVYHHCSSHDLNLALCHSCKVKEVHMMLDSLKHLGLFFKYSPKRSRRLETAIGEVNQTRDDSNKLKKSKFKVFCETRWVEKHTCLDDFEEMYEALVLCLEAISALEDGWDAKAVTDANGLLKKITDPTFIVCFQTVRNYFAYFSGISRKLQGSTLDIIKAYDMIEHVKTTVKDLRNDTAEFNTVYESAEKMASTSNTTIEAPRRCGRQTQRSNIPSSSAKEYFHRSVYLPFVDALESQINMRFTSLSRQVVQALMLLPKNHGLINDETCSTLLEYFKDDLPAPGRFRQEVRLWQRLWSGRDIQPDSIRVTLADENVCRLMYPNIYTILHMLLLTSVTSSSVERANSALKHIKNKSRSAMKEDRFNALALLFLHKDIDIDIKEVINIYATRHPRRMLLLNPLLDS